MAGLDSLTQVKNAWTIDDLMDAHDLLDAKERAEDEALRRARGR